MNGVYSRGQDDPPVSPDRNATSHPASASYAGGEGEAPARRKEGRSRNKTGSPGGEDSATKSNRETIASLSSRNVGASRVSATGEDEMRVPAASMVLAASLLIAPVLSHIIAWRERTREGPIKDAIESGAAAEYNKDDCVWRRGNDRDVCPDPDVHVYLYTPDQPRRSLDPLEQSDWLRRDYEPTRDNVILIHGYAGDILPLFRSLRLDLKFYLENEM